MRRHKNWLKWSLGLVVLAFVIFYIPDFLTGRTGELAAIDTVAVVEGREISSIEFQRTYLAQLQAYQAAYGGSLNDRLLRQLGIDQQILQQLVDEYAAFAEAERLKIQVSDEEVRQRIILFPAFQENGVFIGEQRYRQLLGMQRPPLMAAEFEGGVRRALAVEKLRAAVSGWLSISEAEVEQQYRRINEKVKLAVVSFPAESFRDEATVSDDDVAAYFEAHREDFRIPEKRQIRYALIDVEALRTKLVVPPADIERFYNDNFDEYSTPEQVRASHILLTTEGKEEDAVRKTAEDLLAKAQAGADFAVLAEQYSEDQGTATTAGDLDYFERGRMVPEFDAAAFALEPDQISELVQTQYGFHIIKLTDKKPGTVRTLEEVRPEIVEELSAERAQTQAADLAEKMTREVSTPADLEAATTAEGLTLEETGFFARDEPILGLGASQELAYRVFELDPGEVSEMVPTARGYVMAALVAKVDAYIPELADAEERVRDAATLQEARELAQQRAEAVVARLKGASNFEGTAKANGLEAQTTELIARDSPVPLLGTAPQVIEAAFALPQGAVTDPIATDTGMAIVKVLEKEEVTPEALAENLDGFREEMLADRRNRFFDAYMAKARQSMDIQLNRETIQRIVG